jgi:hypothetical protein
MSLRYSNISDLNETDLQFLIAGLSREAVSNPIGHLKRAFGAGLFFADWEYEYYTGTSAGQLTPDSVVHEYLLKNGVAGTAHSMYL